MLIAPHICAVLSFTSILGALAFLSAALGLWQWVSAVRFPLHQRRPPSRPPPPITVLKPLKGRDPHTSRCLESWLQQQYPGDLQFLFGAACASDPAIPLVEELMRRHPQANASFVLCGENLGCNAKVSTLCQLLPQASHPLVLVSDADVWAPPDLIHSIAASFDNPALGLSSCLYELAHPSTLAMQYEAVAMNADFWSQVLQARSAGAEKFALGAVMVMRRAALDQIGGFNPLLDMLADDYQLGRRIAEAGYTIGIESVPVACWSAPQPWREVLKHQLRWARTIRVCQPFPFFFSILGNATLWPLLWAVSHPAIPVLGAAGGLLVLRLAAATALQARLTKRPGASRHLWLVLMKDLLQFFLWALAFGGNLIEWRGARFRLRKDGRLVRESPCSAPISRASKP